MKLLYFASLRQAVGVAEETVTPPAHVGTVGQLVDWLRGRSPRHAEAFADLARVRGIDLHTISKALGHSSLTVTENYLKGFDQDAIDGAMDELFGRG